MKCVASTTTEIIRFDNVNELKNWLRQENEARIIVDEKPHYLKLKKDGTFIAVEIGTGDEHVSCDIDPDDLPSLDVVGVFVDGETDDDYSRFGLEI